MTNKDDIEKLAGKIAGIPQDGKLPYCHSNKVEVYNACIKMAEALTSNNPPQISEGVMSDEEITSFESYILSISGTNYPPTLDKDSLTGKYENLEIQHKWELWQEALKAKPSSEWISVPDKAGWYWLIKNEGATPYPEAVFKRPGHEYLCILNPATCSHTKRDFISVSKMGAKWLYIAPPKQ